MIVIVDYKMGNLGSVKNMLKKIGAPSVISSDPIQIAKATKIILPGVGSFNRAMESINHLKLKEVLNEAVLINNTPILGICLGMQLMTNSSEEGDQAGLGWIDGKCIKFRSKHLRIPHMGWNYIHVEDQIAMANGLNKESKFYFVHSYFVSLNDSSNLLFSTRYGNEFCSAFHHKNIFGVQFHPEKSHKFGMQFLTNFINY
jgi:glutamine amidotransferase|tara:strand:- start:436 stop:1038 length:603 start_codon:yes stop_codon:yes gene_type:complete